jgi:hypothetical protein
MRIRIRDLCDPEIVIRDVHTELRNSFWVKNT